MIRVGMRLYSISCLVLGYEWELVLRVGWYSAMLVQCYVNCVPGISYDFYNHAGVHQRRAAVESELLELG